jgi:hypothetical protein
VTEDQRQKWIRMIRELVQTVPRSWIVNCDETAWLLHPNPILTSAERGSDSIQAKINGNKKDCVTVLASVSASGSKLPLVFIAAGKTERVEQSQIGDVKGHWRNHSTNGWQSSETFQSYLENLRSVMGLGPIHLLLDCYSAHRTDAVKEAAVRLGITLRFVPPGLTDKFQPLDRAVFGVLKAQAKRLFHARFHLNAYERRTKQDAVANMVNAWSLLGESAIDAAWDVYNE